MIESVRDNVNTYRERTKVISESDHNDKIIQRCERYIHCLGSFRREIVYKIKGKPYVFHDIDTAIRW